MFPKRLFLVLSLAAVFIVNAFAGPLENCELKVGWEDWAPYIYMKDGRLRGREYSYLEKLADKVGCDLQFIEEPWNRSLVSLKINSLDMLYGASYTKERAAFAQFSKPYRYEQFVLMSMKDQTSGEIRLREWLAEEKSDATPKVLGVIRGFCYGERLEPIARNASSRHLRFEVRSDDQMKAMLISGRIDGFIVEKIVGQEMLRQTPKLKMSRIEEAHLEPVYLMFSLKVSPEVVALFNAAIIDSTMGSSPENHP